MNNPFGYDLMPAAREAQAAINADRKAAAGGSAEDGNALLGAVTPIVETDVADDGDDEEAEFLAALEEEQNAGNGVDADE
jgi:hypothetical protein